MAPCPRSHQEMDRTPSSVSERHIHKRDRMRENPPLPVPVGGGQQAREQRGLYRDSDSRGN